MSICIKIHRIVEEESAKGKQIIIIGNEKHPEVEGIMGWSHSPVMVVDSVEKLRNYRLMDKRGNNCIPDDI